MTVTYLCRAATGCKTAKTEVLPGFCRIECSCGSGGMAPVMWLSLWQSCLPWRPWILCSKSDSTKNFKRTFITKSKKLTIKNFLNKETNKKKMNISVWNSWEHFTVSSSHILLHSILCMTIWYGIRITPAVVQIISDENVLTWVTLCF